MAKRINVILPETTISIIDRLVKKGERSRLIDNAVQHYVATRSPEGLREQLKTASIRDRDIDSGVALDWVAVDNESWQNIDQKDRKKPKQSPGPAGVKSTSPRSTRR